MSRNSKLFVTGAAGHLGGLVIDALLERVPADIIVAGVRDPDKEAAVAIRDKGVEVRVADYSRPETLNSALADVDRLLLISGTELGQRRAQHRNVIDAAKGAGVSLIAYTSVLRAGATLLHIAEEHRETEADLAASGVPFALLRNGWYSEVFFWRLPLAQKLGSYPAATGEGRVSPASRADYAEAAATVLTGDGHAGRVYELAGDVARPLQTDRPRTVQAGPFPRTCSLCAGVTAVEPCRAAISQRGPSCRARSTRRASDRYCSQTDRDRREPAKMPATFYRQCSSRWGRYCAVERNTDAKSEGRRRCSDQTSGALRPGCCKTRGWDSDHIDGSWTLLACRMR